MHPTSSSSSSSSSSQQQLYRFPNEQDEGRIEETTQHFTQRVKQVNQGVRDQTITTPIAAKNLMGVYNSVLHNLNSFRTGNNLNREFPAPEYSANTSPALIDYSIEDMNFLRKKQRADGQCAQHSFDRIMSIGLAQLGVFLASCYSHRALFPADSNSSSAAAGFHPPQQADPFLMPGLNRTVPSFMSHPFPAQSGLQVRLAPYSSSSAMSSAPAREYPLVLPAQSAFGASSGSLSAQMPQPLPRPAQSTFGASSSNQPSGRPAGVEQSSSSIQRPPLEASFSSMPPPPSILSILQSGSTNSGPQLLPPPPPLPVTSSTAQANERKKRRGELARDPIQTRQRSRVGTESAKKQKRSASSSSSSTIESPPKFEDTIYRQILLKLYDQLKARKQWTEEVKVEALNEIRVKFAEFLEDIQVYEYSEEQIKKLVSQALTMTRSVQQRYSKEEFRNFIINCKPVGEQLWDIGLNCNLGKVLSQFGLSLENLEPAATKRDRRS